jgi:hypothetical protein
MFGNISQEGDKMLRRVYLTGLVLIVLLMCFSTVGLSETDEPSEPIYEDEYHLKDPLQFIIEHRGSFSLDVSLKVYDEPQENEGSEGPDAGYDVEWDEPLYYKGSTKTVWLTYNGFGFTIIVDGPDAGLNTDIYILINLRHIVITMEIHISTSIIPV